MSKFQYCNQCPGESSRFAEKRKQTSSVQPYGGSSWGVPDGICAEPGRTEGAGATEKESEAKKDVQDCCVLFSESAITGSEYRRKQNIDKLIRVFSDSRFDANEFRQYVGRFQSCERTLMDKQTK